MIATIQLLLNRHILENKQSTQCIEKYPFVGETPALCFQIGCFRGKKRRKKAAISFRATQKVSNTKMHCAEGIA